MLGDMFAPMRRIASLTLAALIPIFAPHLAEARWLRAESPKFVIYSDGAEDELRDVTRKLEEYDALWRHLTGAKAKESLNKLTIYLLPSNK